ncbi:hypothetical protein JCM10599A_25980 [Paraburkholderia kururiensis]
MTGAPVSSVTVMAAFAVWAAASARVVSSKPAAVRRELVLCDAKARMETEAVAAQRMRATA